MDSEPQILPRTRSSRRKRTDVEPAKSSTGDLEKMLRDVKTNEERNREVDQWSFEFKVMIAIICVAIIGLAALVVWFMWKKDIDDNYKDEVYNKDEPPGMNTSNIPPELAARYMKQLHQNQQMQQQAKHAAANQQPASAKNPPASVTKESMKSIIKKMKVKTNKKKANGVLGPVPGEKIDNPKMFEKKHVEFKDPEVDSTEFNVVSTSNSENSVLAKELLSDDNEEDNTEIERQNAMDMAVIYGD